MFFAADWPRRWLRLPTVEPVDPDRQVLTPGVRVQWGLVVVFVTWQLLFPLRHWLYPGNASWTEEGHQFAWRMMLRTKGSFVRVYATEGNSRKTVEIPVPRFLSPRQTWEFVKSPHHVLTTARFFADGARSVGLKNVEIRTILISSLNGRKPQLLIDPELDLLTIEPSFYAQPGIISLTEPRRTEPWDVPSDDWPGVIGVRLPVTVSPAEIHAGPRPVQH
jgi:hypothetical protein